MSDRPPPQDEPIVLGLPSAWYLGGHGDPVATFDNLALVLHPDGSVQWTQRNAEGETIGGVHVDE